MLGKAAAVAVSLACTVSLLPDFGDWHGSESSADPVALLQQKLEMHVGSKPTESAGWSRKAVSVIPIEPSLLNPGAPDVLHGDMDVAPAGSLHKAPRADVDGSTRPALQRYPDEAASQLAIFDVNTAIAAASVGTVQPAPALEPEAATQLAMFDVNTAIAAASAGTAQPAPTPEPEAASQLAMFDVNTAIAVASAAKAQFAPAPELEAKPDPKTRLAEPVKVAQDTEPFSPAPSGSNTGQIVGIVIGVVVAVVIVCAVLAWALGVFGSRGELDVKVDPKLVPGALVQVETGFMSNNEPGEQLFQGEIGIVQKIDKAGDALIRFSNREISQWVFKAFFGKLIIVKSSTAKA